MRPEIESDYPPEGVQKTDKATAVIEAATDEPKLVTLTEFIANASENNTKKEIPK